MTRAGTRPARACALAGGDQPPPVMLSKKGLPGLRHMLLPLLRSLCTPT